MSSNPSASSVLRLAPVLGGIVLLLAPATPVQAQMNAPAARDTTRVTFDEAVNLALQQNTELQRARADARMSSTQVQAEWLDFSPNLSFNSSLSRSFGRTFNQLEGEIVTQTNDRINTGISSGITLFSGFENVASLEQAQQQATASDLNVRRTRRTVIFNVIQQATNLLEQRELVSVRREEVDALREQLRQTERQVEIGSLPSSELYTKRAEVAEAEQQAITTRRDREVAKTELIQTLQLNPRQTYRFDFEALTADSLRPGNYHLGRLMDAAFQNRLDLRRVEAQRRAAKQEVRTARSARYPTISVGAGYGTGWTSRARSREDGPGTGILDQFNTNRSGSVSLSLNIPIYSNWQRRTQVEQAQVQRQKAKYTIDDRRQTVALEVRQAYLDYRSARQQLEASRRRLEAAEQAREQVQRRYRLGSATGVQLRNANRDYVSAASSHVQARYNLILQAKKIDYRVGRLDARRPLSNSRR